MKLPNGFNLTLIFLTAFLIKTSYGQMVPEKGIHLADPTIFYHDDTYYLYGTVEGNADQGFLVYSSSDMKHWTGPVGAKEGFALSKENVFGDKGFWAPQVFYHNQQFYMAYTANENIAIAKSDSPLGPFTQEIKKSLDAPVKQIDPYIYQAEDGKVYLYHVRLKEGNRIYVAEMAEDLSAIKEETLTECIDAGEGWENTADAPWPVAEGPTIIKKSGRYYLIYSANDFRNPDYAVGYVVSEHPLGPWKKHTGNPILHQKDLNQPGTGHGDLFSDKTGGLWYIFHTHFSEEKVAPRRTALIKMAFSQPERGAPELQIEEDSFYFLKHP
jgi:xylan 1,4-beta-xylosidase